MIFLPVILFLSLRIARFRSALVVVFVEFFV